MNRKKGALALAVALHFALPVCAAETNESAGGVYKFKQNPST